MSALQCADTNVLMPNHGGRNGGEIATQRPNIGAIGEGDAHYALLLHSS
jgi:hypothetical protein